MLSMTDDNCVSDMPVTPETLVERYEETNYPVYKDFVSFFVSGVVGVRKFDRNKCHVNYKKYVTISDEAFTVLTLENNWKRWCSMAAADDWKDSDEPSKWTTSKEKRKTKGIDAGDGNSSDEHDSPQAKRCRGWSAQGIARYNQLFEEIKKERESPRFGAFETYCIKEFVDEAGKQGGKRKRTEEDRALPSARHELWDDVPQVEPQQQTVRTSIPRGLSGLVGPTGAMTPV